MAYRFPPPTNQLSPLNIVTNQHSTMLVCAGPNSPHTPPGAGVLSSHSPVVTTGHLYTPQQSVPPNMPTNSYIRSVRPHTPPLMINPAFRPPYPQQPPVCFSGPNTLIRQGPPIPPFGFFPNQRMPQSEFRPYSSTAIPSPMQTIFDHINHLDHTLVRDIRLSSEQGRNLIFPTLKKDVEQMITDSQQAPSLQEQADVFLRIAILFQNSECFEQARHYLLACSGFTGRTANDQQAIKIAELINKHTTLTSSHKSVHQSSTVESTGLTKFVDSVKLRAMIRLAWNNGQLLKAQLNKQDISNKTARQLYLYLGNTLGGIDTVLKALTPVMRSHLLSPSDYSLLNDARDLHRLNSPHEHSAQKAPSCEPSS